MTTGEWIMTDRTEHGDDVLLTTREAARLIGVSPKTLERWRVLGTGPRYFRFRQTVRYRRSDVEAFIRQHTHGGELRTGAE